MLYHLNNFTALLGVVVALVGGLYVHDAAQVLVGRAVGDRVAAGSGRLTWRIAPHLDVYGAVCAVVVGYGWGAPVPVDDRWRGRRRRVAVTMLAGPAVYVLLAIAAVGLVKADGAGEGKPNQALISAAATWCGQAVLSVVPVPPMLDGGRALFAWGPVSHGWQQARYQLIDRNIGVFIAIALVLLPRLFSSLPDPIATLGGFVDTSTGFVGVGGRLMRGVMDLVGL
ncbi:MAG TPA: hypothetical protein VHE83_15205 [Mycobacteriales bacterium]|nr:hypothetical protein [Mycobacteriales bacterium]